jgi:hypothetical protein
VNENQANKNVRKKNRKKNQFFVVLLLGIAAIFLISFLSLQNGSLKTSTAMLDSVEDKISKAGILAFDEELFTSSSDGEALFMYPDGQRIVSKVKIATVYKGSIDAATKDKLMVANNNIKQSETRLNNKVNMPSDPAMAKKEVSTISNSLAVETDEFDYSNVYKYKNDIISRIDYINAQSGKESLETKNIEQLKNEISAIENSISYEKKQYYNTQTGIFSTKIDGFENVINHKNVKDLKASDLKSIMSMKPETKSGVVANQPFCKVINNFRWYISGIFTQEELGQLKVGSSVKIRIPGLSAVAVRGTISSISEPEDEKYAVTISSADYIEGLFEARNVEFELIKKDCSGFRIPQQALTIVDGEEGVFVIRSGVAKFRPVKKVYEDKNFILSEKEASSEVGDSSGIVLYDLIILEPEKVYEDKIIKGYST